MPTPSKTLKKFSFNYGPESRRWSCTLTATSSAGTIPEDEITGGYNIYSASRLANGNYQLQFINSAVEDVFVIPRLVGTNHPSTGSHVVSATTTGCEIRVFNTGSSGNTADHAWTRLDLEFWGRFSK